MSEHLEEAPQIQDTSREWDEVRGDDTEGMQESPPESVPKEERAAAEE